MVYAYDQWAQMPVKDLYDTQIMAMSIAAAKDMYEKGQKQLEDFNTKYGDFMSPFAKDMERYQQIVGGIRDTVNNLYSQGIDPLRSAEGRALVAQAINSVNPAELSAMKANAKMGYAYQDALQKLRSAGKYSQAQEDFDMALTGATPFSQFATNNGAGGFNSWDRSSPIQATTLRELTQDSYKGRTPRVLTKEDFKNDPRLVGKYAYDPRYEWTGYLYSDLLKNAPGASASLAADPRAAFFRDQARQMVIAQGKEPTAENVESQFQRNIADANTWALVDPVKKADEYAKMQQQFSYNMALQKQQHKDKMDEIGAQKPSTVSDPYSIVISNTTRAKLNALNNSMKGKYINDYAKALSLTDEKERERAIRQLDGKAMKSWLTQKVNGASRFKRIMDAEYGNKGVLQLDEILSSRAVNGNIGLDESQILKMAGFQADDGGWYKKTKGSTKVLSPHQILKNILKYESGLGFAITDVNGGKTTRDDIIKQLSKIENSDYLWTNATTKERVSRTKAVSPQTVSDTGGYIVAPNDKGIPTLYMKVAIKQGATANVGSWLPQGEHDGFWVEVPISQTPQGTISLESVPVTFGQDLQQRKDYGDAASTHASENLRY